MQIHQINNSAKYISEDDKKFQHLVEIPICVKIPLQEMDPSVAFSFTVSGINGKFTENLAGSKNFIPHSV